MLKKIIISLTLILPMLSFGYQDIDTLEQQNNKVVGKTHLEVFFFNIYDAELLNSDGKFNFEKPFLLKIKYLRNFSGENIASRTITEMKKQHHEDVRKHKKEYLEIFDKLIPDVKKGDVLYGYMDENGYGYLYSKNKFIGQIPTKKLSKYFFQIWLGDNHSMSKMTKELRGEI